MNPQRILVVEDDGIVGRDLQETLVRHGYSVPHVAATGERAVELAAQTGPDLVLMDIALGGTMDGVEAARRIHEAHGTPVIYVTGGADNATRSRAESTGPFGFLIKPFGEKELIDAIRGALNRWQSIRRLEESARDFARTLRSIAEGVIATDLAGNITLMNPLAETLTGWPAAQARGRPLREVFPIRGPGAAGDGDGGEGGASVVKLTARDGTVVPVEENTAPIKDEDGCLAGLVVVFRLHRPPRPEEAAAGSGEGEESGGDEQLVRMVESIVDPMFTMDADWRITYVNPQAAGFFGSRREAVVGRVFWDEIGGEVREEYEAAFSAARRDGRPHHFEFFRGDEEAWFFVQTYPFAGGVLVLFRDITGQKRAEEERTKMEKLEDLGLLARGFAHDFNNLLTVLLGNLSLASGGLAPEAGIRGELEAAKQATLDAQNLVQQLLTFAKGGAPIKRLVNLRPLVEEVVTHHAKGPNPGDWHYATAIDSAPARVHADPGQLRRLLENLVRNAEQASLPGGRIVVECGHADAADAGHGDVQTRAAPPAAARYAVLRVIDHGHGIGRELMGKVFEPYFSTRGDANASGLGLTVCESIARAHGGFLRIASGEGQGTTVSAFLPAAPESEAKKAAPESQPQTQGQAAPEQPPAAAGEKLKRILILEDEPLIRELIVANLRDAGFDVEATAEGGATVAAYEAALAAGRPFDLVLTDLSIPDGMGGAEAVEQIRRVDPDVRAIVSSGYSNDPVMSRYKEYGFSAVLPKPYDPMELRELIERLLGDSP